MLALAGCVQPSLAPSINAAAARVLDRIGISLVEVPGAGCCGAVRFHLNDQEAGRDDMRALIDAWWPMVGEVEAIVMTASGCGINVKEYGHLLAGDPQYRAKAERISALTRDLSEIVGPRIFRRTRAVDASPSIPPARCSTANRSAARSRRCSRASATSWYRCATRTSVAAPPARTRCSSPRSPTSCAPQAAALEAGAPQAIATANIGCLTHLQQPTATPVRHWIELVDEALA